LIQTTGNCSSREHLQYANYFPPQLKGTQGNGDEDDDHYDDNQFYQGRYKKTRAARNIILSLPCVASISRRIVTISHISSGVRGDMMTANLVRLACSLER
jgi:hypothetical protein